MAKTPAMAEGMGQDLLYTGLPQLVPAQWMRFTDEIRGLARSVYTGSGQHSGFVLRERERNASWVDV